MNKTQMYFKGHLFCVFTLLLMLPSANAFGATIHVPGDQPTIQAGIDAAADGDEVLVHDGTYVENIELPDGFSKAITVRSENGPEATIIDGNGDTVVQIYDGESGTVFQGFTVINGSDGYSGFGIDIFNDSSPTITDCIINNNWGGIWFSGSSAPTTIAGCIISNNVTYGIRGHGDDSSWTITDCTIGNNGGEGIWCSVDSSPTITDCIITTNAHIGIVLHGSAPIISGCTISDNNPVGISCMDNLEQGPFPKITNCIIENNSGGGVGGGGIYCFHSDPTITDCIFRNNYADSSGGGITSCYNYSSLTITNCTISGNTARWYGGGIHHFNSLGATLIVTNCTITDNSVTEGSGGGISFIRSQPTITNCTITGNTATNDGGGIYCGIENVLPTVVNSILWDNIVGGSPNEIHLESGATIDISYSNIKGGWTGTGNINSDPLFVDSEYGDFHLQTGSPCVDAGDNDAPELPTTDFEGDSRKVDDPNTPDTGNGTAPIVDIGADEYAPDVLRANFNAYPTAGAPPLLVQFTDHSTGSPIAWSWDLDGDGTEDSSAQDPSFTYMSEGRYTVTLTVTNGAQDTVTKTDYINVVPAPVANFSANPTSGDKPLQVTFTDASTGSIDTWEWDFDNNGTVDSTAQTPTPWIYTEAGDYTVTLTVAGPGGSDSEVKVDYIHVSGPTCECDLVPDATVIPRGESLGFQATVTNNTALSGIVHFVTFLTPPPPDERYPASGWLDHYTPRMTAYGSKSGHISHTVPVDWPLGTYIYHGRVGQPGPVIYDECQFQFEVVEP